MKKIIIASLILISPVLAYFLFGAYTNWKTDREIERMYQASTAPYRKLYQDAVAYEKLKQESIKEETELLKKDTHGGKTPEETLALFVKALKQKDPVLASKYYLPWKQKEAEKEMRDWIENKYEKVQLFIQAYEEGRVQRDTTYAFGIGLNVYPKYERYPYIIKFELNKINNIWKISDF